MNRHTSPVDSGPAVRPAPGDADLAAAGNVDRAVPSAMKIADPETRLLAAIAVLGTAPLNEDLAYEVLELQRQARGRRGSGGIAVAVPLQSITDAPKGGRR